MRNLDWRLEVRIPDVPLVWTTNLSDKDLFDFYLCIPSDPAFQNYVNKGGAFGCCVSVWGDWVPFMDGFCYCFGFINHFYIIYRTAAEWEIWEARKTELAELEIEAAAEESAAVAAFWAQDRMLWERMRRALETGDELEADRCMNVRVSLLLNSPWKAIRKLRDDFVAHHTAQSLALFTSSAVGLRVLDRLRAPGYRYVHLAERIYDHPGFRRSVRVSRAREICDAAVVRFGDDGILCSDVCRFWQRKSELAIAIEYCSLAVAKGIVNDGRTKTGLPGLLRRLQREATKLRR